MAQQVIDKVRSALKPDPDNPRKQADEEYIVRLAADIKLRGILVPLIIRPDDTILDGWCRWLAASRAALEKLPCIVTTQQLQPGQILAMQMATVMHRADITGYEKWLACERLRQLNPTWLQKDIAAALSLSDAMILRLLSPSKCTPAWQDALKIGKVGISDCYQAALLPEAEQQGLLNLKLSGASRDAIAAHSRKARTTGNGNAPAVKAAKVTCQLPSGVQIVVKGEGVSLDEAIEVLSEAMREMKKAKEQGYTAKTFAAAMRDKSQKG